jgi:hypothetical protein
MLLTAFRYRADPLAAGKGCIVDVDHERLRAAHQPERIRDYVGEFGIDQDDLRPAMVELKRDRGRIEANVECIQHGARHRHGKVRFVHRRHVGQHRRDRVALADALARKVGRKAPATLKGLRPGEAAVFIDCAEMIRINGGAAFEEAQRRQRHVIGGIFGETNIILVHGHLPSQSITGSLWKSTEI